MTGRDTKPALERAPESIGAGVAYRGSNAFDAVARGLEPAARFTEPELFDKFGRRFLEHRFEQTPEMPRTNTGPPGQDLNRKIVIDVSQNPGGQFGDFFVRARLIMRQDRADPRLRREAAAAPPVRGPGPGRLRRPDLR